MRKIEYKNKNGITLIALVITIIVLLILAGVAISMLSGENGILKQAADTKTKTELKSTEEQVKLAAMDAIMRGNDLTTIESVDDLNATLATQGLSVTATGDATTGYIVETEKITYEISANGTVKEEVETISTETSYVGYYANLDEDEEPEGIIYADLAIGGSGKWGDSYGAYSYDAITGTKDYYVSKTNYEGAFGTKDVLTATGSGADRFYVMALEDFKTDSYSTFYWYETAYYEYGISGFSTITSGKFGTGKDNTDNMIEVWNEATYGAQNARDMWGVIQEEVKDGWFVPSIGEWGAFGNNLGVTSDNYSSCGLPVYFWSSTLEGSDYAALAGFGGGMFAGDSIFMEGPVRMSTTF